MSYMYIEKISSEMVYRKSSKICRFFGGFFYIQENLFRFWIHAFRFEFGIHNLLFMIETVAARKHIANRNPN